jgi:hypothetical protein
MKHILHIVLMVAAYLFHATVAPAADETPPTPKPPPSVIASIGQPSPPAIATTTTPQSTPMAAMGKSDLDDELPPDVRAKLSPEQLRDVMIERAKRPHHSSGDPPAVAIIVPLAMFALVFAIVVAALYANFRRDRHRHETIRLALERGGAIPPELLIPPRKPHTDLRRGVLLLCAGLGLAVLLFKTANESGAWTAALIPIFLGLGYLAVHKIEGGSRKQQQQQQQQQSPEQA